MKSLADALDDFYKQVLLAPKRSTGRAKRGGCDAWRKFASGALAVHPRQVKQANARNARHGIGTRYDATGKAIIPDRADRKRLMRLEGMHDNEGGFGD